MRREYPQTAENAALINIGKSRMIQGYFSDTLRIQPGIAKNGFHGSQRITPDLSTNCQNFATATVFQGSPATANSSYVTVGSIRDFGTEI